MISIWTFRAAAVQWLRYKRQCPLVSIERRIGPCNPDVMAVEKDRTLTEIEIKRTMADFRANKAKHSLLIRETSFQYYACPKLFYFLVPVDMVEKCEAEVDDRCGLLTLGAESRISGVPEITLVKRALANPRARRLDAKELRMMAAAQSGTLFSVLKYLHKNPETVPVEVGE